MIRLCDITLGDWVKFKNLGYKTGDYLQVDGRTYINLLESLRIPRRGVTEEDFMMGIVPIDLIDKIDITPEILKLFGFIQTEGGFRLDLSGDLELFVYTSFENTYIAELLEEPDIIIDRADVVYLNDIQSFLRKNDLYKDALNIKLYDKD